MLTKQKKENEYLSLRESFLIDLNKNIKKQINKYDSIGSIKELKKQFNIEG